MNIFDATLKIKKHSYNGSNTFLKIKNNFYLSCCPLSLLNSIDKVKRIRDFNRVTKNLGLTGGMYRFPDEIITNRITYNDDYVNLEDFENNLPEKINTKEYWNFLHKEFQFCDVMTYPIEANIKNYFRTKLPHYVILIEKLEGKYDFFKNKKILEIGPSYGILPGLLKNCDIKCDYYCCDLVKRFNYDNFIEVDGYHLLPFITDKFDIIIMSDVIQHLSLDILDNYFIDFNILLKPEGNIIISAPDLDEENYLYGTFFAQSILHPSKKHIRNLMNKLNFDLTVSDLNYGELKIYELWQIKHKLI